MMGAMEARRALVAVTMALCAAAGAGQTPKFSTPARLVEIRIPQSVPSEQLFVRYVLAGQDFGEGIYGPAGVPAFGVSTVRDGWPASWMKAILYAPGCAIQTLDLNLTVADAPSYAFVCRPVGTIELGGALTTGSGKIAGHVVRLQAKYTAHWAQAFLGLGRDLITSIPIGEQAGLSSDGSFRIRFPDLSENPLPAGWSERAELQIVAKDESTGAAVALLVPPTPLRTSKGGLRLLKQYPEALTFQACSFDSHLAHDAEGFAIRPETNAACAPL